MGLPVSELVVATNVNDILERTLRTGRYEVTGVVPTSSPSMDIQVSSNSSACCSTPRAAMPAPSGG